MGIFGFWTERDWSQKSCYGNNTNQKLAFMSYHGHIHFNFRDICDRNLWDTGYLVKILQGYGILRPSLMWPLGPAHTNPFSNENGAVLLRFGKKICVHTYRFRIVFARPHYNAVSVWKRCYTLSAHGQMNSMHALFNISAREIGAKLKPHGSVCPPFWILTVEWSGARSCLFWWRHRFQIVSFFSVHTRKQRF